MTTCDSLYEVIASGARTTPEAPALLGLASAWAPLTYRGLAARIERIGAHLVRAGVRSTDRVALALPNGPDAALATLAVATHATCVPLDPGSTEAELDALLGGLDVPLMLVPPGRSHARGAASRHGIACVEFKARGLENEDVESSIDNVANGAPSPRSGDAIAVLLHTSGTTSKPKRVPLTHRNLCRSAANIVATLGLTPEDRCLNPMPLFHAHGLVGALLSSLSAGASVVCAPGLVPERFAEWLRDCAPTWYTAVPTMHQAVLNAIKHIPPGELSHALRFARSSSASLPPSVAREFESVFGVPIIEAYGMTEAAHQIASNPLPPLPRAVGSVGFATGTQVAVVDDVGVFHSQDASGEIVVRGDNVMQGYLADPQSNATAFVHGWFRTGDCGSLDARGCLRLDGRLKEIIKRGGESVAPREVEEALLEGEGVLECVVFGVPHPTLGEDIAAAVVLRPGASVAATTLRRALFGRLSDTKIPSRIIVVETLPRTATGKIRRSGMAQRMAQQLRVDPIAPRAGLEAVVAGMFAEILEIETVGANDNFFVLGGDSLRGGQVLSRIHAKLGVEISLATLFRLPTAGELAIEIEHTERSPQRNPIVRIVP